jgi:hypothetical protein
MGQHRLHSALIHRAILVGTIAAIAGGCWEEIHYTGPDPSLARRRPQEKQEEVEAEPTTSTTDNDQPTTEPTTEQPPPIWPETPPESTEVASAPIDAAEHELFEEPPPEDVAAEEPETEQTAIAEEESEPVDETQPSAAPDPALATRLAAWQLGSKLTLAALANDRRLVPRDVAEWFSEARSAAETLGTSVADLPAPPTTAGDTGSRAVHDYLFQQGQRIWRELTDRHGNDHAALFEAAVKSNVLLVLYQPGSPSVEPLANSIRDAAPKAELPAELFDPLLDTLTRESPVAEVRVAVRELHTAVERYLRQQAERTSGF